MKILQLVTCRQRRGAEVFAAQLSDGLAGNGHEVILVGLYPPPSDALTPATARAHDLSGRPERRLSYGLISELRDLIRKTRPDVVQANGSATLKYASLAKMLSRGRWPLVYRNISIASHWLRYPTHRLWGRWLMRRVGHVAAVSNMSGEDFRRTYGVAESRISAIPIGVHIPAVPRIPELRVRLVELTGISRDSEILLHVGSFTPEKNHAWLIDAFSHLHEQRPSAHLLLVGDGPLRSRIESAVTRKGLHDEVHLLGTRADVPTLVGGADLLLLPSTIEGIPAVLLEAAAQGVPAVATAVGSISDAVQDGRTGVLVAPGNMPAFVSAVAELLGDPVRRRTMGAAAYTFVKEHYAIERIITRFEQLYGELCNGRR